MGPGCTHVFISYNFSDVILFDTTYSGASRLGPVARKRTTPTQSAIFSIFLLFPPTRPLSRHRYPTPMLSLALLACWSGARTCPQKSFLSSVFASSPISVREMGYQSRWSLLCYSEDFCKVVGKQMSPVPHVQRLGGGGESFTMKDGPL